MSITVNIRYKGKSGAALSFAKEMMMSGNVEEIRNKEGNLRYEYYVSLEDPDTILLIDSWRSQEDIDKHHDSPMMNKIMELREKYDLHMIVERYQMDQDIPDEDKKYIRG